MGRRSPSAPHLSSLGPADPRLGAGLRVRPPRALWAPFPHGYPLHTSSELARHREVLEALLELIERLGPPPVLEEYRL